MEETWRKLGEGIVLEAPNGNDEGKMTFLGCEQTLIKRTVNGKEVCGMQWGVSQSMRRCVTTYEVAVQQCTGKLQRMTPRHTPFLPDETQHARCRAPASEESFVECPTCMDTFPASMINKSFTFPAGCPRSIKKFLPMITKDICVGTDDGGVQPWMHNFNA